MFVLAILSVDFVVLLFNFLEYFSALLDQIAEPLLDFRQLFVLQHGLLGNLRSTQSQASVISLHGLDEPILLVQILLQHQEAQSLVSFKSDVGLVGFVSVVDKEVDEA